METTINITIPEDFRIACEIFDIPQTEIIQRIVNNISLPYFFSHPGDRKKWAMLMFLDYLDNHHECDDEEMAFHEPYMIAVSKVVPPVLARDLDNSRGAEDKAREIIKNWHAEVLRRRAGYLIDNLPEEN